MECEKFHALAEGGQVQMPLGKTFWSPCFGMVTDRFGVGWMVTVAPVAFSTLNLLYRSTYLTRWYALVGTMMVESRRLDAHWLLLDSRVVDVPRAYTSTRH